MITGVSSGNYTVKASYIGHRTQTKSADVGASGANVNFSLATSAVAGEGVFVTGTRAAGRTAMKSPTPIDGFDDMALRRQGNGDLTETLKNQVPGSNKLKASSPFCFDRSFWFCDERWCPRI